MVRSPASIALILVIAATGTGTTHAADPSSYVADSAASHLDFTGMQAGAEFKGTFHKFSSKVVLSPAVPESSHIDVDVELNSLDTKDNDRDKTMRGPDIFDIAHYPTAHYATHTVTKTATGFSATGALTLHGVTREVPILFTFTATAPTATLNGTATLKRLDFGVGQGDWKSTEWIADVVKVSFSLILKPGP